MQNVPAIVWLVSIKNCHIFRISCAFTNEFATSDMQILVFSKNICLETQKMHVHVGRVVLKIYGTRLMRQKQGLEGNSRYTKTVCFIVEAIRVVHAIAIPWHLRVSCRKQTNTEIWHLRPAYLAWWNSTIPGSSRYVKFLPFCKSLWWKCTDFTRLEDPAIS